MFKQLKKQARTILFLNLKQIIIPVIIYICFRTVGSLYIHQLDYFRLWDGYTAVMSVTLAIFYLLIKFILIPIYIAAIYKSIILSIDGESDIIKKASDYIMSLGNIKDVVAVCFIPSALEVIGDMLLPAFDYLKIYPVISLAFISLQIVVNYKLLAALFYCVYTKEGVGKSLAVSIGIMKNRVWEYIKFSFAFLGWELLVVGIAVLINIPNIISGADYGFNNPLYTIAMNFGFGINLLLYPYQYTTASLYIKRMLGDTKWDK